MTERTPKQAYQSKRSDKTTEEFIKQLTPKDCESTSQTITENLKSNQIDLFHQNDQVDPGDQFKLGLKNIFDNLCETTDQDDHNDQDNLNRKSNPSKLFKETHNCINMSDDESPVQRSAYALGHENFDILIFNKIVPQYKGDQPSLKIFLRRCETYLKTLSPDSEGDMISCLVYKLSGKAFRT